MDVLKRFKMMNCKPTLTPTVTGTMLNKEDKKSNIDPTLFKRLIGNFMYLTATRPNIMYVVSLINRFMEPPKDSDSQVSKRILRYIVGRRGYGIY